MNEKINVDLFPKTRIKAYDGMAITAEIWQKAHDVHRDELRAMNVFLGHIGIIDGLEVKANDPADHYVFVSPGIAIDSTGQVIVVDQTIAYEFGDEEEGTYFLFLGYGEREIGGMENQAREIKNEFIIAARSTMPKKAVVELARVTISRKGTSISNPKEPSHPMADEIDQRFRVESGSQKQITVAVIPVGDEMLEIKEAWDCFGTFLKNNLGIDLIVDINVPLTEKINNYDILYLYSMNKSELGANQIGVISSYYKNKGKSLFMEGIDQQGITLFMTLGEKLGIKIHPEKKSKLYTNPYLFRMPPEGIDEGSVIVGQNAVLCGSRTASRWNGYIDDKPMPRQDIRSNMEWGANILNYCVEF